MTHTAPGLTRWFVILLCAGLCGSTLRCTGVLHRPWSGTNRDHAQQCARRDFRECDRLISRFAESDAAYALDVARWSCGEGHGNACMHGKRYARACELGIVEGCGKLFSSAGFARLEELCTGGATDACQEFERMGWRSTAVERVFILDAPSKRVFFPAPDRMLGSAHGELALWDTRNPARALATKPLASIAGEPFTFVELNQFERDASGHWRGLISGWDVGRRLWMPHSPPRYRAVHDPQPTRFLSNNRQLALGRDAGAQNSYLAVVEAGRVKARAGLRYDYDEDLQVSESLELVAHKSYDEVVVRSLTDLREVARFKTKHANGIALGHTKPLLAVATWESVRVWDLRRPEHPVWRKDAWAGGVAFSPDDRWLAWASPNGLTLSDAKSGAAMAPELYLHPDGKHALRYLPKRRVQFSRDGHVVLLDAFAIKLRAPYGGVPPSAGAYPMGTQAFDQWFAQLTPLSGPELRERPAQLSQLRGRVTHANLPIAGALLTWEVLPTDRDLKLKLERVLAASVRASQGRRMRD